MQYLKIFNSVGKSGKNVIRGVKIVQAMLNVYFRVNSLPVLSIDGKNGALLEKNIMMFQSNHLNSKSPDGRIDPNGKSYKALSDFLKGTFKPLAISQPDYGVVTWNSEGSEGGAYHSRKLHVPGDTSGVTIGRGYDLRRKTEAGIEADLTSAGVMSEYVVILKKAAGKFGATARQFIIDNDILDFQVAVDAQKKLFKISYQQESGEARRICEKKDVEKLYGKTDWDNLNIYIRDLVIDLKFRGDYTSTARRKIQKSIANNDVAKFKKEIKDKANWPGVPEDRFKRRVLFIDKAPVPLTNLVELEK